MKKYYKFSELSKEAQMNAIRTNRDIIERNVEHYLAYDYHQNVTSLESTGMFNKPLSFAYPDVWFISLEICSYKGEDFHKSRDAVIEILQNAINDGNCFSDDIQKIRLDT